MSAALTEQVLKAVLALASPSHVSLFDSFNVATTSTHFLCDHLGITEAALREQLMKLIDTGALITPNGRSFRGADTTRFLTAKQRKVSEARLEGAV